jgi:hypothetical protein
MRARLRDAVVLTILLVAGVAVRLAWHPLGPWVCLGIAFGAGLTVIAVYRVHRPADLRQAFAEEQAPQQPPVLLDQDSSPNRPTGAVQPAQ